MKRTPKPYWEMTTEELGAATAEFNEPFAFERSRPLNREERAQWERMKRKRGRPRRGRGAKVVSVSFERGFLAELDRLARRLKTSRSRLLAAGAQRIMAEARAAQRGRTGAGPASRRRVRKAA